MRLYRRRETVTYVEDEDREGGLLALATKLLLRLLDILLQLTNGILKRCPGVVDLIDDQDVLSNQVGHLQGAQIEPLRASDLGTGSLFGIVTAAQILIQRETNSLDGDVRLASALQERSVSQRIMSMWFPLRPS